MEKATGKPRPTAPAGTKPIWQTIDDSFLYNLMGTGRAGFVSRIGKQEIATTAVLVKKPPATVWNILTDFENYPGNIQMVTKSKVQKKDAKSAEVKMKTEIIKLGPIGISTEGVTRYYFDKPKAMWSEDVKKPRKDLISRWELVPFAKGKETGMVYESVSDISSMGTIANIMLGKLPKLQISIDLSQGMVMADQLGAWATGKKNK